MIASFGHQVLFALFPLAMAYRRRLRSDHDDDPQQAGRSDGGGLCLLAPLTGMDLQTFGMHWAAGGIVLAGAFLLFAVGWIGGGDAKFAAAAALWLGWATRSSS